MTDTDPNLSDSALLVQFAERRAARLEKDWSSYQPAQPIASDLHDCRRYQVMRVLGWKVRKPPDLRGLQVIEQGRVMEDHMIRQLQDEGWPIVEQQAPFEIRQPLEAGGAKHKILSGRIDGKFLFPGSRTGEPFDTKDTSEWTLERCESEADLLESPWLRKWWRQIQVYCLGENSERGWLVLGFRGDRQVIPVHLDYEVAESIIQDCTWAVGMIQTLLADDATEETVDVKLNELGVGYFDEIDTCRDCPFYQTACFPPDPQPVEVATRPELEPLVRELLEAKPYASRYKKLYDELKQKTEGCPTTVAGAYVIDGQVNVRNHKPQPAKGAYRTESWGITIRTP